jgi:two-component system invasion response regulator UvrY
MGMETMIRPAQVLIVDDQPPFREAARLVVELSEGFEVAGEAVSGEESLELVRELSPDIVLMDINLPGIDGIEATRRIVSESPNVRVIVLSTYEAEEYEPRALAVGATTFIGKSDFSPDTLAEVWPEA